MNRNSLEKLYLKILLNAFNRKKNISKNKYEKGRLILKTTQLWNMTAYRKYLNTILYQYLHIFMNILIDKTRKRECKTKLEKLLNPSYHKY